MDQAQYRRKEEQQKRERTQSDRRPSVSTCPNCGSRVEPGDAFCCECGAPLMQSAAQQQSMTQTQTQVNSERGAACRHCHKPVSEGMELCPHCGKPLHDDKCTFCGAPFEGNEAFCMECGSARAGIACPKCGTLSFRSFCPKCNAPLNDNALMAIRQAEKDPKFQRARQLAQEMASMESYLSAFRDEIEKAIAEAEMEGDAPDMPGLTDEGQALQAKYAELMGMLGQKVEQPKPQSQVRPSVKRRELLKQKFADADRIMDAYQAKAEEMQRTLASMFPDSEMSVQQYRDYMCARKVAVVTQSQKTIQTVWECNFCHMMHDQPSECVREEMGGTWHYQTLTITNKVWQYVK